MINKLIYNEMCFFAIVKKKMIEGVIGITANIMSRIITHPMDVIKTNYQISAINNYNIRNNRIHTIVKNIYKKNNLKGFYK